MGDRSISICLTYVEFLLRNDTQSPTRKILCRDAIGPHSLSYSPFLKLMMCIIFIYEAHRCVMSVLGPGRETVESTVGWLSRAFAICAIFFLERPSHITMEWHERYKCDLLKRVKMIFESAIVDWEDTLRIIEATRQCRVTCALL